MPRVGDSELVGGRLRLRMAVGLLGVAGASALLAAPAVPAAVPITIGQGHSPAVAVDGAGTAYVAWVGPEPSLSSLHYCRLPRGAQACDRSLVLPAQAESITRPFVEVTGSVVRVLSHRFGFTSGNFAENYLFTSTDGGSTFGGPVPVGITPFSDAASGPGAGISLVTNAVTQGEFFQRVPTDGTTADDQQALLSADHPYVGAVALLDPATPIATFADANDNAQFRRYDGTGDINSEANWTPAVDIGRDGYMHLAGGPSGVFLKGVSAASTLEVRRFNGVTFGSGVNVPEGTGELPQSHMFQDPTGRLHVVWPRIDADGIRFYYSISDDGVNWLTGLELTGADGVSSMRVAAAADHIGVAAWQTGPTSNSTIRVAAIGPEPLQPPGPAGLPAPVLGRSVNVFPLSGRVRVSLPPGAARAAQVRGRRFVSLGQARQIPVRSLLDTRRGKVRIVSATDSAGATQSGDFSAGTFQVLQSRRPRRRGLTELRLKGSSFSRCRAGRRGGRSASAAQRRLSQRTVRRLRANASGRYRSRGRNSAATVRGTVWTTADRCDGTLTTVKRGRVAVRDFRRKRTIVVRAGKRYLARAKR
jgi:hypothetical protein